MMYFYDFKMNDFQFLSLGIKFQDDVKYQHLDDTLRGLTYVFIHHIDIWLSLYPKIENILATYPDINAGNIFKELMVATSVDSSDVGNELKEYQMEVIAKTFLDGISATSKLSRYMEKTNKTDSILTMWEYCHYLFVPVRLDHESIPDMIKVASLRKWTTLIFTLPFMDIYRNKFSTAYKEISYIKEGKDRFNADPSKIKKIIEDIAPKWTSIVIGEVYNNKIFLQSFVRMFMTVSLLASVEILKIYNPAIVETYSTNISYDGKWVMAMDPMYSKQNFQIKSLMKYISVKQA